MARITVVGAGVVGLTTAVVLERMGHDVTVVADERGWPRRAAPRGPCGSRSA